MPQYAEGLDSDGDVSMIQPDGEGSKSRIPITGAGSPWAVMGLVRSR
jgi:hypothetical protein